MNRNIKLLITIILSFLLAILISLKIQFNIFLVLLISIFIFYILCHFIFKIKDIYDFIYKKRYLISGIILIILVLGKFNGSSIGLWNTIVEPNNKVETTLIGENRKERSDEWFVNTPFTISQKYNDYKYYSDLPRAEKTEMFTTIFVPVKDILIVTRPFNIGYILGEEYGLSFYWYGRLIVLLLVTFELMMLLTNKKKLLSLSGAILITGSSLVSWFFSNYIVDLLISGQLCILLFNSYLETKNNKLKILYSILLGLSFSWFTLTIYPAWQVPLGYMFLVFAIWVFIKNLKNNKHIKDYLFLLITLLIVSILVLRYYMLSKDVLDIITSTIYPGNRISTGKTSLLTHFIYPISIFFGIADYHNPCEVAGVYSLFPIPIIISILYLIKNKRDKDNINILILLLTILSILLTIFTLVRIPELLSKITLLSMSPPERVVPIIGLICAYLIILTTGKLDIKNNKSKVIILFVTIVTSYIIIKTGSLDRTWYLTNKKLIVSLILLSLIMYLYITSKNKRNEIILSLLLIFIGLINIVIVNPINIGTKVMHNTNTAKEIRNIVKQDKESRWISINNLYLGNYVIANGGKAINSTNIYPNLDLWKKIDKNNKYKNIYNRYSHVMISLTEEETSFELSQRDTIYINLNYNDLNKLAVDYIISSEELTIKEEYKDSIIDIYHYDNIWIYKYSE